MIDRCAERKSSQSRGYVSSPFSVTCTRLPGASPVPVAIAAISGNSGALTPIGTPSAATPRTWRTAVPRVRWRKPTSASPRMKIRPAQRPIVAKAPTTCPLSESTGLLSGIVRVLCAITIRQGIDGASRSGATDCSLLRSGHAHVSSAAVPKRRNRPCAVSNAAGRGPPQRGAESSAGRRHRRERHAAVASKEPTTMRQVSRDARRESTPPRGPFSSRGEPFTWSRWCITRLTANATLRTASLVTPS